MEIDEFRSHAHDLVDWMADYLEGVRELPVKSQVQPGDILQHLPEQPPDEGEPFNRIFHDFENIIIPGMTHWQHPAFFAYWPANSSPPSVLGEMLTATLGAQCMSWVTSPAATELEERVMQWLGRMLGLPAEFDGVIQDTASTATLCSILTARERATDYRINAAGFQSRDQFIIYCSSETHSSIEKAAKIAGLGREHVRKLPVDDALALKPDALDAAIAEDYKAGLHPLAVVATLGTTGTGALDPLKPISDICRKHKVWLHVDAAYAGTALLLPEMRWMIEGIEAVDTFVVNPHKWMFTNFDCSAYFVKDKGSLIRTFEILPEYLKTAEGNRVNNYRDWGIQLGRRFRALKLWFVIRSYGVKGLQAMIRHHLLIAEELKRRIEEHPDFELLAPMPLNLLCFRYHPEGIDDEQVLENLNERLVAMLNQTGKMYLTHTRINGRFTIRLVTAQTRVDKEIALSAWDQITRLAEQLA